MRCTLPAMKLGDWMAANGVDDDEMARRAKSDRTTVSRNRRGVTKPTWDLAGRYFEITGGAVTPNDFLGIPAARPSRRRARAA